MEYSIRALSELAGVSARTLRYYDEIGLLKPKYVTEAGYRFYGEKELAILQQILFYRERGFDLKQIRRILFQDGFDLMNALEEHLLELEKQRAYMDFLIRTVKQTISSMKGECKMSDQEKFAAFKERMAKENEAAYGAEIRETYGEDTVDASNRKMLQMSEEEWDQFQKLGSEINDRLKKAVLGGRKPESEEAKKIAVLHREWLMTTWPSYTASMHKGVAAMYTADARFAQYYDQEVSGCAQFLKEAVEYWADRL